MFGWFLFETISASHWVGVIRWFKKVNSSIFCTRPTYRKIIRGRIKKGKFAIFKKVNSCIPLPVASFIFGTNEICGIDRFLCRILYVDTYALWVRWYHHIRSPMHERIAVVRMNQVRKILLSKMHDCSRERHRERRRQQAMLRASPCASSWRCLA